MLAPFCLALLAIGCVPHTGADQRYEHVEHEDYDLLQEEARVLLQTNLDLSSSQMVPSPSAAGAANLSRHPTAPANISFAAVGASRQEYDLRMDSGRTIHVRSKVVLAFLNMFGLGCLGIDRCYMGQSCAGIVKGLTLGGLGFWTFLDYVGILVTCLMKDEYINYLGYKAEFTQASVIPAFWITMTLLLFMCFCGGGGTLFYRGHLSRKLPAMSKPSKPPRVTRKMRQKLAQQGAVPAGSNRDPALLAIVEDDDEDDEEDEEDEVEKTERETGTAAGRSRQKQDQHPAVPAEQHQKPAPPTKPENVEGSEEEVGNYQEDRAESDNGTAAGLLVSRQKQDQYPAVLAEPEAIQKVEEGASRQAAEEEAKRLAAEEEKRKAAEEQEARRKAAQEDNEDAQSDNLDFDLYKKVEDSKS